MRFAIIPVLLMTVACTGETVESEPAWRTLDGNPPLIIAHRGASGELPEHTMAAYERAIEQGADVIEPDLVMTRDGVLIARHDRFLSLTTDIASRPEFADRRRDSDGTEDWWVEDFDLAEIRTLRAVQHFPGRPTEYDGLYPIATFEEVLDLALEHGVRIEPETKHPGYFAAIGLDLFEPLVAILRERGLDGADSPVSIQSFEPDILVRLNEAIDTPLLQLVFPATELDPEADFVANIPLETLVEYADGVGPYKALIFHPDGTPTDFIDRAHALGLSVHAWTFRTDRAAPDGVDFETEVRRMLEAGADAIFTDQPGEAVRIRDAMIAEGAGAE